MAEVRVVAVHRHHCRWCGAEHCELLSSACGARDGGGLHQEVGDLIGVTIHPRPVEPRRPRPPQGDGAGRVARFNRGGG